MEIEQIDQATVVPRAFMLYFQMKAWEFVGFFFFSSRRRHTSLTCDWSSDVCSSDLAGPVDRAHRRDRARARGRARRRGVQPGEPRRSEEHTSELQSHVNLVCRLLLEKKKKNNSRHLIYYKKNNHNNTN